MTWAVNHGPSVCRRFAPYWIQNDRNWSGDSAQRWSRTSIDGNSTGSVRRPPGVECGRPGTPALFGVVTIARFSSMVVPRLEPAFLARGWAPSPPAWYRQRTVRNRPRSGRSTALRPIPDNAFRQAALARPGNEFGLAFKNSPDALFVKRMDDNEESGCDP
jgi:hypothetical protein